jgi:hypothetical protein
MYLLLMHAEVFLKGSTPLSCQSRPLPYKKVPFLVKEKGAFL